MQTFCYQSPTKFVSLLQCHNRLSFAMFILSILFHKIALTELQIPHETVHILVADTFLPELI